MSSDIPSAAQAIRHDLLEDVEIDANVAAHFPPFSKVVAAIPHGASFWTRTSRVTVELVDGSTQTFFLKAGKEDLSREMLRSEFEGSSAIYSVVPDFIPRPVAWGTYRSNTNTHYYMAEFVPMIEEVPEPQSFCAVLAKLHKDSIALSENGKFGFHVTTYGGTMPNDVTWCDTWEESFARGLRAFAEQEKDAHGPNEALEELFPRLFGKVIPRLLGPLITEGRTLKPVLIHGDLWYGNMATNANTGDPVTFDPSVLWAHNEYELNSFNVLRYKIGRQYMREYHKHFPVSAPEEDYEDRNRLYAVHTHFCSSTLYPTTTRFREMAIQDIAYLVEKYASGIVEHQS